MGQLTKTKTTPLHHSMNMLISNCYGGNPNKTILMGFNLLQTPSTNLRMILLFLLTTMFASCTSTPSPSRRNLPTAEPNCVDHCGNISIPYPFGTTPDCYRSPSFLVTCNRTVDPPKLLMQQSSIEITDISLDGQIRVLQAVAHHCYARNGTSISGSVSSISLPRQHFTINNVVNKFITVGCDTLGLASGRKHGGGNYAAGFAAVCVGSLEELVSMTTQTVASCMGTGCSAASIPEDVREFNVYLGSFKNYSEVWDFNNCGYAFLAEETAFSFSWRSFGNLRNVSQLPIVVDWAVGNGATTCEEARANSSDYACKSRYSTCHTLNNGRGYQCRCRYGYEGNPYLDNGCQDIDECENADNLCTSICTNTNGGFECSCPKGYYGDGRRGSSGCRLLPPSRKINVLIGLVIGVGSLLLLSTCFWLHKVVKRRAKEKRKTKFFKRNGGLLLQQQTNEGTIGKIKIFPAKELEKATDNFNESRILGQGGQGTVYKGMLANGQIVAIKKSKQVDEDQLEQLINEVAILSQINHKNVVKLLGCCLETEVPLLVYEFVPNGTLFNLIHDPNSEFQISWNMRLKIAADIAGALAYLHSSSSLPIYHRDIKTSNILLDEKYVVKVSDFGTSKSLTVDQTHVTTLVKGTFGYLDPEYFQSSHFTEKSDVYSFGVVLLELLTGQRAVSMNRIEEEGSLVRRFLMSMERDCADEILDDQVWEQGKKEEVVAVARLAQRCLNLQGKLRPTMKEVATELESIRMSQMPVVVCVEDDEVGEDDISEGKMTMISDFVHSWTISGRLGAR